MEHSDVERDKLLEEAARLEREMNELLAASDEKHKIRSYKDESYTTGYTPNPLPPNHWSLDPAWKKSREGINIPFTPPAPLVPIGEAPIGPADMPEAPKPWSAYACALAGVTQDAEND